jgi:integrase
MLTIAAVKAARTKPRAYKIYDERGLFLFVSPTGLKSYRLRFRFGGKEQLLVIGSHPEVTLDQARDRRDSAHEQIARGEDPRAADRTSAGARTFEQAARAWHALRVPDWTPIHAGDVMVSLERDAFPAIGALPLGEVTRPQVLALLRAIEARGAKETARRIQQRISCVFKLAMSEGWCDINPAGEVTEGLAKARAGGRHPAIVDAAELRDLLAAVDALRAAPVVVLASRFLALTAVRLGSLRGARWDEIEDLDGAEPVWRVPAARMKLSAEKKLDPANDHLVPLSPAAVTVLRRVRAIADASPLIFPAGGGTAPIAERAIGDLYRRAGYAGRHVPHGWRASFSTILNEAMPDQRGTIDRALGHAGGGKEAAELKINVAVEGAYNRSTHLGPRRALFDAWAAILVDGPAGATLD